MGSSINIDDLNELEKSLCKSKKDYNIYIILFIIIYSIFSVYVVLLLF